MEMQDYGIYLEIFGFIILLLVSGRNPKSGHLLLETHEDSSFDIIRGKIIPDRLVSMFLIIGIGAIVLGLLFQLTNFNPS